MTSKQQGGFSTNQMFQVEWRHCMPRVDKFPLHMEDWKRNSKKKKINKRLLSLFTLPSRGYLLWYALGLESSFSKQPLFLSGNLAEYIKLVSNRLYPSLPIASPWSSVMCHPVATLQKNTPFTSHYAFKSLYKTCASMIENRVAVGRGYMNCTTCCMPVINMKRYVDL